MPFCLFTVFGINLAPVSELISPMMVQVLKGLTSVSAECLLAIGPGLLRLPPDVYFLPDATKVTPVTFTF